MFLVGKEIRLGVRFFHVFGIRIGVATTPFKLTSESPKVTNVGVMILNLLRTLTRFLNQKFGSGSFITTPNLAS